jgi:PmbA protein
MTDIPTQLLELALKAGATHAEIYQSRSLSRPAFFEANRLKQLESSQSEGIALRLWREGCPGLAVAYGPVEPQALVDKAIALSYLNPPEPIELAEARKEIHPNVGETIAVETLVEVGKNVIAQIREAYPDVLCSGELQCEQETTLLMNSQGLHCQYADTGTSYYFGIEWVRGEDFLGVYDGEYTRGQLNTDTVIQQLLQRLEWAKTNATPPTGRIPVLFTASAATLLWGIVAAAANGKQVLEKASPWSDKLGELVISQQLNLSQQPHLTPYSCPFDDEGTPTQFLSLIAGGKLQQFYTDCRTARELGGKSTGNGFRPGLGSYPAADLVNLVVEPGSISLENLIAQLEVGLVVDQVLGGGPDLSGDFSVNIDLGYCVKNGEIVGRVKDTMVAGNVYTALKQVVALGSDARWNGSCHAPSLIVEGLSVVG